MLNHCQYKSKKVYDVLQLLQYARRPDEMRQRSAANGVALGRTTFFDGLVSGRF